MNILDQLKMLCNEGRVRPLDYQFGKQMRSLCPDSFNCMELDLVAYIASSVSYELSLSNICVPYSKISTLQSFGINRTLAEALSENLPPIDEWQSIMNQSGVFSDGSVVSPLVYDSERIYIYRYWLLEQNVASKLNFMSQPTQFNDHQRELAKVSLSKLFCRDYELLSTILKKTPTDRHTATVIDFLDVKSCHIENIDGCAIERIISSGELQELDNQIPESHCLNWQKVAAAMAITRKFSVISGGPGTGKTTTVSKLLAALGEISDKEDLIIKLGAPTGKAAARLTESISKAMQSLPVKDKVKSLIPTEASTIHRLLGAVYKKADFRHNNKNKLHLDVLVIDEASMMDLVLISKLLDAIPEHATIIFLGDKDQLASVEAGSVLGDICGFILDGYSQPQANLVRDLTGFEVSINASGNHFTDSLCMLRKSYRFHKDSGIGQLAYATNSGKSTAVHDVVSKGFSDINYSELNENSYFAFIEQVSDSYCAYLNHVHSGDKEAALSSFAETRLLCATREGNCGIQELNNKIESALYRKGMVTLSETSSWYEGRPIMVNKNDHSLGLYNGDIGICMREEDGSLYVFFESPDSGFRRFLPSRLPDHETNYAMTIHKSQGSEFETTYMLLPEKLSPVLTRELIYTGITRAKGSLKLCATKSVLDGGVAVKTKRDSGLVYLLGQISEKNGSVKLLPS